MIERNEDVKAQAKSRLQWRSTQPEHAAKFAALELALHAYEASPTAAHYDHLWSLLYGAD
jgi:hypothetical protein